MGMPQEVQVWGVDSTAYIGGIDPMIERTDVLAESITAVIERSAMLAEAGERLAGADDRLAEAARAAAGGLDAQSEAASAAAAAAEEAAAADQRMAEMAAEFAATEGEFQARLEATNAALAQQRDEVAGLAEASAGLAADVDAVAASVERQTVAMKEAGDAAETNGEKTAAFGSKAKMAFLGVAVGLALAVHSAGDFQQQTTRLVTSAGESARNLGQVQHGIEEMSGATNTSMSQLTAGMYMVESAGFHAAAGLKVLKASAEGAQAEGADLSVVTNAVTSALNAYHLGAGHATQITNEMVAAVGQGKMTFQDLAGSMATVLPIAAQAHLSFAQVGGAIATMTAEGTSANEAAQEIRHTILALLNPTQTQSAEMGQLGINSVDLAKNLGKEGLSGTINEVQEAILKGMGPAGLVLLKSFNQSQLAAQSADEMIKAMPPDLGKLAREYQSGAISVAQWNALMFKGGLSTNAKNLLEQFAAVQNKAHGFNAELKAGGGDAQTYTAALAKVMGGTVGAQVAMQVGGKSMATYEANVKAIGKAGDETGKDISGWGRIQHTFNFELGSAVKSFIAAGTVLGTILLPAVLAIIHPVQGFLGVITQSKAASAALAIVIGGALAAALGVKLQAAFNGAAATAKTMVTGVGALAGKFRGLGTAAEDAVPGEEAATAGMLEFDAAADANPIGLIVLAIEACIAILAGLVVGLYEAYKHFKAVREVVHEAAVVFQEEWAKATQLAGQAMRWFENGPMKSIEQKMDEFKQWWARDHENVERIARIAWAMISTTIRVTLDVIVGIIKFAWASVSMIFKATWDLVSGIVITAWHAIYTAISTAIHGISDMVDFVKDIFEGKWSDAQAKAKDACETAWHGILSFFKGLGVDLWHIMDKVGRDIIEGLVHGIEAVAETVWHVVDDIWHGIVSIFHGGQPEAQAAGYDAGKAVALGIQQSSGAISAAAYAAGAAARAAMKAGMSGGGDAGGGGGGLAGDLHDYRESQAAAASGLANAVAKGLGDAAGDFGDDGGGGGGGAGGAGAALGSQFADGLAKAITKGLTLRIGETRAQVRQAAARLAGEIRKAFEAGKITQAQEEKLLSGVKAGLAHDIAQITKDMHKLSLALRTGILSDLDGTASQVKDGTGKLITIIKDAYSDGLITYQRSEWLEKVVGAENTKLTSLANQRARIMATIAAAKQYESSLQSNLMTYAGLTGLNAVANASASAPLTAGGIITGLRFRLDRIREFGRLVKELAKKGLNKALIDQIVQAGPDQGIPIAKALLDGPAGTIAEANRAEKEINSAAAGLAKQAADVMYDSGKQAGKGFLSGLKAQEGAITKLMQEIARKMVQTLRRELGIHSKSKVGQYHGLMWSEGIAQGIDDGAPAVDAATLRITRALTGGRNVFALTAGTGPAAGGAGGGTVNNYFTFHITVPHGFIGSEQQLAAFLFPLIQKMILQNAGRNASNGLSVTPRRGF